MRHAALARSVADTANAALEALSTVGHLLPNKRPMRDGLEALRAAYKVLGVPDSEVSWDLGEELAPASDPPPKSMIRTKKPPKPAVRAVRRKRKQVPSEEMDDVYGDDSAALEASRCRAFLLEVVRRAVHDWVLYRQHEKRDLKVLANDAYIWLFEEGPGHRWWHERQVSYVAVRGPNGTTEREKGARRATSFLAICEAVSLDPEVVRKQARKMTVESILRAGRPAERRRSDDSVSIEEHGVVIDVDLQSLDEPRGEDALQYAGYTSYTPSYM